LRLRHLSLVDVRNYAELILEVPDGLVVFVGANAQGKTNLLEAIGMLATGKSFRTARESEVVRLGAARGIISGEADVGAGRVRLACEIAIQPSGTRKAYRLNGEPAKFARYLGSVRAVTFTPGDLVLVDGPAAARRATLNGALSQSDPRYYRELALYTKVLAQKRALLRGAVSPDTELLATYNQQLALAGASLIKGRAAYVEALSGAARGAHRALAEGAELSVTYRPEVGAGELARRLAERRALEIARKAALVGPHRDDIELLLGGVSLAAFGSQGQKRTAVLALKLAEHAVLREVSGEAPLFLLDDVLSELDERSQRSFLDHIVPLDQIFLTATSIPSGIPQPARIFHVQAGDIEARAC
jgi:DNA replication and repair protein RecF